MKKRIVLLTALVTLVLFAAITGCKRGDDNIYFGDVTFWNDDATLSDIRVTVDNSYVDYIETFLEPSFCNQANYANFNLSYGYHSFSATTVNGTFVGSGTFYMDRSCQYVYIP